MKYFAIIALSALTISAGADMCSAQAFGNFTPAAVVGDGGRSAGAYFTVQDDLIGVLSQFRYGASDNFDFGFQAGVRSMDYYVDRAGLRQDVEDTHLLVSGDAKYMIREADAEIPIDLSLDFGVGFADMKNRRDVLFTLGGQGGWRGPEPESRGLDPYVGLVLIVERKSLEREHENKTETHTRTNNELEARLGTAYRVADMVSIVAEIQAGRETAFGVGLNFIF